MCLRVERKWDTVIAQVITSLLTVRLPNALGLLLVLAVILGALFGVVVSAPDARARRRAGMESVHPIALSTGYADRLFRVSCVLSNRNR